MTRIFAIALVAAASACAMGAGNSRHAASEIPGEAAVAEPSVEAVEELGPAELESYVVEDSVTSGGNGSPGSAMRNAAPAPHPFVNKSDAELEQMLLNEPESLGPISIGRTSSGALFGAVAMPKNKLWKIVNPRETWGTQETVDDLARCISAVSEQFPNTAPLNIGDISDRDGGHLTPHISHQSGRDVDVGYYYKTGGRWYVTATRNNLDLPRTWAFVRAIVTKTDVEAIFIDRSIQRLLRDYAAGIGEDTAWLDQVFGGPAATARPIVLHEKGHKTHIHVRFYNPVAQETGRRLYRAFVAHKKISPPTYYIKHKVRRGDTLGRIAKKYKTTVRALKRANGLRSSRIYANRTYRIPRKGGVRRAPGPLRIPPRRLPPSQATPNAAATPQTCIAPCTTGKAGGSSAASSYGL